MPAAETARLIAELSLDPRKFNRGADQALGKLGKLEGGFGRIGKGGGQLATGLGRAGLILGGAVVAGIGGAAKAAIDFEDAFAGVRKTVDETDLQAVGLSFDQLATKFRTMATEIPIAATEFARLGETAGALGVKAQDIDDFVKTTALLGVTTDLTADAAAEALGKVGTILGLTGKDYEHFADVLVNLGNKGASTESEILETAKRFAGVGRQAGLTSEQILALSSAITSLGAEPEAGGSALSRIFSNMGTEIANATKKGEAFADLTGDSLKTLASRINKGDSLGIFRDTIKGLAKLKTTTEKYKFLKALGITNVRDRDAIVKVANDIGVLDDSLKNATNSTGALGVEAGKRFDTIASKVTLLKNNAIEAGITIGEGMLPAIGRATDKLVAFLKDPVNKGQLKALGEDIGSAIDKIEWDKVLDGAKTFVGVLKDAGGFALGILETLNKLPTELKAAGLGFLALNKLSGGLIAGGLGNIAGGLLSGIAGGLTNALARAGVGKLFVQPVFVTNMGAGMGAGAAGAAGAGGKGGGLVGKVGAILGVTAVAALASEFSDEISGLGANMGSAWREEVRKATGVSIPTISASQLEWPFGPKNTPSILPELFGGNGLLGGAPTAPKQDAPGASVLDVRDNQHADLERESQRKLEAVRSAIESQNIATRSGTDRTTNAINTARINQVAATRTGDAAVAAEIRRSRPILNVRVNVSNSIRTTVYRTGTTINRTSTGVRGALLGA